MGHAKILLICSALFLAAATGAVAGGKMKARADIKDATGKTLGTANLTEEKKGVKIVLKVSGLSPGRHGFHLHEKGACDPPDFKSAGGHFNPFGKHHGAKNPEGKHAGDFQNLEAKENGTAEVTVVAEGATLGKGAGSLLKEGGTSIVIHADADDEMSDPAGNSGARIGCGTVVSVK
jgi:Cu-Zn family superoxide dismutase